ncbi:hypothetical protein V5799_004283 [Amblyomma americanum]|uniref:Uncharacterized protein n=1 Tax=Amblyomma americanum TaxID=6943 RepID=A0AAQ4D6J5_AMBAM
MVKPTHDQRQGGRQRADVSSYVVRWHQSHLSAPDVQLCERAGVHVTNIFQLPTRLPAIDEEEKGCALQNEELLNQYFTISYFSSSNLATTGGVVSPVGRLYCGLGWRWTLRFSRILCKI